MVPPLEGKLIADDLTIENRIHAIHKDIWIDCPQSRKVLDGILCMLQAPRRATAPCILVCGDGGSGKTTIKDQLEKRNEQIGSPCVFVTMVDKLNPMKLSEVILEGIGLSPRLALNKKPLPTALGNYLRAMGVRAIVIDEFHEALLVPKNEQLKNLSLLKGLSGDPFNISIILLGTKASRNALMGDPQLSRRYHIYNLEPWSYNSDFRSFIATMEQLFKLNRPSGLHQPEMLRFIYERSGGVMDNVVKYLKGAAIYAVKSGEERITKELIEMAASDPWGYGIATRA